MGTSWQSAGKTICCATGAALAGPAGALLGSVAGGLLGTILPGASGFVGDVFGRLATKAIADTGTALAGRLTPAEKQRINHDLQTAFRDAFRQALYDVGGERCFPRAWKERPRDVPTAVIYPLTPQASKLWRDNDPLAGQVCACFQEMERALAAQTLLPLEPPADQPLAHVESYLEAESSDALSEAFFEEVLAPFLAGFGSLRRELPGFEAHLRRTLVDRTLVHLGENLKARTPAWRAFNRLILEGLREKVRQVASGQAEIATRLDALLAQPGAQALTEWADGLADLLTATGQIEKRMGEGFGAVLDRVVEQHAEVLARFEWLIAATGRIETKVDRVLHFLENGQWVIEGAPSLVADEPPAPGEPPFKGLQYFDQADAGLFFGRELLTARLVRQLDHHRLLMIVGASGSGKSSVVRAGLLPALQRGEPLADGSFPPAGCSRWPVHVITPSAHPLEALAASLTRDAASVRATSALIEDLRDAHSLNLAVRKVLSSAGLGGASRLLLVVDQFEELFTLCQDEAEREAFVDSLLAAVDSGQDGPTIVVGTLRADFYAHCAEYAGLREALARRQEYIGPMSPEELRRAIEEPARRGGWLFEPGLVDLILRDAGDEPGALPLLQHALLATWQHRRGHTLTLESYGEAGGVRGAIAKTAETVFRQHLSAEQRPIARNVFLRLTQLGEDTQDTRRRAALSELVPSAEEAPAVEAVLGTLADARLITLGEGTAEVAHEALIREWPTLRQWLDENRAGLRVHRRLTEAAIEWERLNRDDGLLYRGARLAEASEWAADHAAALNALEHAFLAQSQAAIEREAAEREAQRQRELEAARRLAEAETRRAEEQGQAAARLRLAARRLAGALLIAALLAVAALWFGQQSNRNAHLAEANAGTAQAASTQAVAEADTRATAQANALQQKATAEAASTQAVAEAETRATAQANALQQKATAEAASAEAQFQGRVSLARGLAAQSSTLLARDEDLGVLLAREAVQISKGLEGTTIPEAQTALYHALDVSRFAHVLRGHVAGVGAAVFSPDGSLIVTASQDGTARLWRADGTPVASFEGHAGAVLWATFSPAGSLVVTTSDDGTARLWRPDGTLVASLEGHAGPVLWATFSPDGSELVTTSTDATARLWRSDGTFLASLEGHRAAVLGAAFSPDGSRIVTTSADATARLWRTDGTFLAALEGHSGWVYGATFSPDGRWIVTAGYDGTARLWHTDGTSAITLKGHTAAVYSAVFSPDGSQILTASDDSTARLWRLDGTPVATLEGHAGPVTLALFSPDGSLIVTASADTTARLWRADGTLVASLAGHTAQVGTAVFSPDGSQIVTASGDGTARLWPVDQLYTAVLRGHTSPVIDASFSPDGKWIATSSLDNTARLWRADGAFVLALKGHRSGVAAVEFSPDGNWIATASLDGTARLWRPDGTLAITLTGHTAAVRSVDFSPDGKWIVTSSEDGTARLWQADGAFVVALEGHEGAVWSAHFSPDGAWIVTAGEDGTARLWKADGTFVRAFESGAGPVWSASFSPDGQQIVAAGVDGIARLWRIDGTFVRALEGHSDALAAANFSPDGSLIVTASYDGTARLWTARDGAFIASLEGHTTWVTSAVFSPDGSRILTASWDGTARQWGVYGDVEAMLAQAQERIGRALTDWECQQYLYQETCP
jgi:WD40 repeat protein